MKAAIFEMSPDTRFIRQHLREQPVGTLVTYGQLSTLIGKPVSGGTPALQSAVRSLLKTDQIVYAAIRGEGVKRLSDSEIIRASDADIDGLRRRAKKSAAKVSSVQDYSALSQSEKIAHSARLSIFAAVSTMASDAGIKKVEKIATPGAKELALSATMEAFRK